MKIFLIATIITTLFSTDYNSKGSLLTKPYLPATCTGAKNCRACKNCKYCKHCAKNGGTCGVCKK